MSGKKSPKACKRVSVSPVTRERVARVASLASGVLVEQGVRVSRGSFLSDTSESGTRRSVSLARVANGVETITAQEISKALSGGGVLMLANPQHNSHARYFVKARYIDGKVALVVVTVSSIDGHDGKQGVITIHRSVVIGGRDGWAYRVKDGAIRFARSCECGGYQDVKAFDAGYLDTLARGNGGVVSDTNVARWLAGKISEALNDTLTMADLRDAKAQDAHNFLIRSWSHATAWQHLPQGKTAKIGHKI